MLMTAGLILFMAMGGWRGYNFWWGLPLSQSIYMGGAGVSADLLENEEVMKKQNAVLRVLGLLVAGWLCCTQLTGCLVAGYSSGGGFWVWPGSILLTLILLGIFFLNRR